MKPNWIAADWGTTNLRVWAMSDAGKVLADASSDQGMGTLEPNEFEHALLSLIDPWLTDGTVTPVFTCGMVGARQGWAEAPYASVPTKVTNDVMITAPTTDPRLSVHIAAGVKQMSPPDVMRGEETQIAGYLSRNPNFDGIICLPGTHSKWAHISAEEIVSFQTFMTGELFSLLENQSILRFSVTDDWDDTSFQSAINDALTNPANIAAKLFSLRAEGLTGGDQTPSAKARLSGLLIGLELAAAKPYWLGQNIALIGEDRLNKLYQTALSEVGACATLLNTEAMTLAGLTAARNAFIKE